MDGLSCLEFLRDIGRRYRGVPRAATTAAGDSIRDDGRAHADRREAPDEPRQAGWRTRRHLFWWRPARIAGERGGGHGYGLRMLLITGIPVVRALPSGDKATLNDALVTAIIATVGRWNAEHCQPARLIRVTVPFNTRMQLDPQAAGNHSRLVTIVARPPEPGEDLAPLLLDVARQVRTARQQPGPQLGASFRAVAAIWCPSIVKCSLVRAALRIAGPLVCDTVMMTNLGKVADPPDFGLRGDKTMAVSGQAQMPRGVSVAAITVDDKLQVAFRFNRALLDDAAADRFAAVFADALGEITHSNMPQPSRGVGAMALEHALLKILVCPVDKGGLLYYDDEMALYNPRLRRRYPIRNDVPVLLAQDAETVSAAEHSRLHAAGRAAGTRSGRRAEPADGKTGRPLLGVGPGYPLTS